VNERILVINLYILLLYINIVFILKKYHCSRITEVLEELINGQKILRAYMEGSFWSINDGHLYETDFPVRSLS